MKKKISFFSILAMMMMLSLTLTGCFAKVSLKSIAIDADSIQTTYYVGDQPDFSGIKLTATYSDKSTKQLTFSDVVLSNISTAQKGEQTLVVTYKEKIINVTITVKEVPVVLTSISIDKTSIKSSYVIGEVPNFLNLKVYGVYSDGSRKLIAYPLLTLSSISTEVEGVQTLTVTYQEKQDTMTLNVVYVAPTLDHIKIDATSIKTILAINETPDFTDIVVKAHYSDGSQVSIYFADLELSTITTVEEGIQNLTVTYEGKTDYIVINIVYVAPSLESLTVDLSSIKTTYEVGETTDFSNIKVSANYSDGSIYNIFPVQLELSSISTAEAGTQVLTITYLGVSTTVTITVIEPSQPSHMILSYEMPDFVNNYNDNIKTKTNKETEFKIRDDFYFVGNQNAFVFKPRISALNLETGLPELLEAYPSDFQILLADLDGKFNPILTSELENYVSINKETFSLQFSANVSNKLFRLVLQPQDNQDQEFVLSFDFKVIDGWNAYTAADLSRLDNVNKKLSHLNGKGVWDDYKEFHNVDNTAIKGMILHSDIKILASDIPLGYTFQAGDSDLPAANGEYNLIGSLRDNSSAVVIYDLNIPAGQTFNFIGNYFTVDGADVPKVKYSYWGMIYTETGIINYNNSQEGAGTHSRLFSFGNTNSFEANVLVKNTAFIGNSNRSESYIDAGGITLITSQAKHFVMDNTISRGTYYTLLPVGHWKNNKTELYNLFEVKNSRSYDSFSNMFFIWGAKLIVSNSDIKNAGGPLFVLIHNNSGQNSVRGSDLQLINTEVENYVSGSEAYFKVNKQEALVAGLKPLITGVDQYANAVGSNYKVSFDRQGTEVFNLVAVALFDSGVGNIKGKVEVNANETNTTAFDFQNPSYLTLKAQTGGVAPIIQSSGGGLGYFDGNTFKSSTHTQLLPTFFAGDYFNLYYGTTGIVVKFNK